MMNIKYFTLLCVTYFTTMVISIDEEQINNLWNAIKYGDNDYINFNNFLEYYEREEANEFLGLTRKYGTECLNDIGKKEFRIRKAQFTKAALKGLIPRWPISVIRDEFKKIASVENYQLYITINDMKNYYKEDEYTSEELDDIMADFGASSGGEWKLLYNGLKTAMNVGRLPKPK